MELTSREHWHALYERKTNDHRDLQKLKHIQWFEDDEHGFVYFTYTRQYFLVVEAICGDFKYWFDILIALAKVYGRKFVVGYTPRNLKAMVRAYRRAGVNIKSTMEGHRQVVFWKVGEYLNENKL